MVAGSNNPDVLNSGQNLFFYKVNYHPPRYHLSPLTTLSFPLPYNQPSVTMPENG